MPVVRFAAVLPFVAALCLAACSSNDGEGQPALGSTTTVDDGGANTFSIVPRDPSAPVDVCSLIAPEEAGQIFGYDDARATAVTLGAPLNQVVCSYATGGTTVLQVAIVDERRLSPDLREQGYDAEFVFERAREQSLGYGFDVTGLGEAAFRHGDTLEMLVGPYAVGISVSNPDTGYNRPPVTLETLTQLAVRVIDGLGAES